MTYEKVAEVECSKGRRRLDFLRLVSVLACKIDIARNRYVQGRPLSDCWMDDDLSQMDTKPMPIDPCSRSDIERSHHRNAIIAWIDAEMI